VPEEVKDAEFELTVKEEPKPPSVYSQDSMLTPRMIQEAEVAVEMVRKARQLALRVTSFPDWVRFGDVAYLRESGCKKVGALFGASFVDMKVVSDDRQNPFPVRTYTATVTAKFRGRDVIEIGTCDSEYDLYKKGKGGVEIPFDERDFTSMKKHAITNALNRATKGMFGLTGIPWSDVVAALGGQQQAGQVSQVTFKGESKAQTVAGTEAKDLRAELLRMALDMASDDPVEAGRFLEEKTAFTGKDGTRMKGFSDPKSTKVSDAWIRSAYGNVKKLWLPEFGGPRDPGQEG
jgi:hypothetical protein